MKHRKQHRIDFLKSFPYDLYPDILGNQKEALEIISKLMRSVTTEAPTGSGKTAIGYTFLKALSNAGRGPLFYTTPTKTLVDQVKLLHKDVMVMYGRGEYQCLYYTDKYVSAEDCPCSLLDCPHRVDQETGMTEASGVEPCPYLHKKWQAKQGGKQGRIVVCTASFYLFTHLFGNSDWPEPAGLVVDEVHKIAQIFRSSLSYEITDYHLRRSVKFLREVDPESAGILDGFLKIMVRIIKQRPPNTLLESHEIRELLRELGKIDHKEMQKRVRTTLRGTRARDEQREIMKRLETLIFNLSRYFRSLEYSMSSSSNAPLNYTYGFYKKDSSKKERVRYRLFIRAYYVAPLIKKIFPSFTVAYSATIGNPETFGFETGIDFPFYTLSSEFPAENTRVFLPKDGPNLSVKARSKRQPAMALRKIARSCKEFSEEGIRSLVVVISNRERHKFLMFCEEEGIDAISYGNGNSPKEAARRFKDGEGDVLVGTSANYGEGLDLPRQLAPVIFFLRPGRPNPNDPATVFEMRRHGIGNCWALWNWRAMLEALQVRGRNIRSHTDVGVTIFISRQFKNFLYNTLPESLKDAFQGRLTYKSCIEETKRLLTYKSET